MENGKEEPVVATDATTPVAKKVNCCCGIAVDAVSVALVTAVLPRGNVMVCCQDTWNVK